MEEEEGGVSGGVSYDGWTYAWWSIGSTLFLFLPAFFLFDLFLARLAKRYAKLLNKSQQQQSCSPPSPSSHHHHHYHLPHTITTHSTPTTPPTPTTTTTHATHTNTTTSTAHTPTTPTNTTYLTVPITHHHHPITTANPSSPSPGIGHRRSHSRNNSHNNDNNTHNKGQWIIDNCEDPRARAVTVHKVVNLIYHAITVILTPILQLYHIDWWIPFLALEFASNYDPLSSPASYLYRSFNQTLHPPLPH